MEATPYGSPTHCVLHVDVDAFFCQIETLRTPSLRDMPIAIIQDRDVIAVSYPARQLGVKKYMNPAKARDILQAAGGRLVRVFQEADSRVSYRPYREASAALMRVLRAGLPTPHNLSVQVVEKASIDEAFILVALPAAAAAGLATTNPAAGHNSSSRSHLAGQSINPVPVTCMQSWVAANTTLSWDLSAGAAVAAAVRAAVHQQLGLTVSVGVASNKLLAKLGSRQAKPDGVVVIDNVVKVQQLLKDTPVNRIPGLGGAVAAALSSAGISHIAQLQQYTQPELAAVLGGPQSSAIADRLNEAGWGRDIAQVLEKGPPKSIQVQLALNAHLWRTRILSAEEAAAAGDRAAAAPPPHLAAAAMAPEALSAGSADTLPRLQSILRAIAGDVLGRVMLDRHSEDRWPKKLAITLGIYKPGQQLKAMSKSTTFPPPTLLNSAPAAAAAGVPADQPSVHHNSSTTQQEHQQMQSAQSADKLQQQPPSAAAAAASSPPRSRDPGGAFFAAPAPGPGPAFSAPGVVGEKSFTAGTALQERVVQLATGLAQAILSPLTPHQCVGHLNLSVGNFGPFEAAATAGDIRRFTTATAAAAAAAAVPQQATTATKAVQLQQEQPLQQLAQQKCDTAASMQEVAAAAKGAGSNDPEQSNIQQQQQHRQTDNKISVGEGLKRKRSAEPVGVERLAPNGHIAASKREQQQQPQSTATDYRHQSRPPLPPQGFRQPQVRSAVPSAANIPEQQKQHAAVVPSHPPVLLSRVLQHLANSSTTAEAAEQQLERLLAAAGLARLLPRQL